MKKKTFQKEWVWLQHEVDAAWEDPSARKEGRSAWAIWRFSARCMTEVFAFVHALEDDARLGFSDEQFTQILKEAEEDIARGVRKLALLVADSKIHDNLTEEFRSFGIAHPNVSHVGFRVRNDPRLSKKYWRFVTKRKNKDRSLTEIQNSLWLFLKQFDESR